MAQDTRTTSEWNVVVEVVDVLLATALAATRRGARRFTPRRRAAAARAELDVAAATGVASAADQLHPVADDLGRVFFDAVLVGVLARLQPPFDVDGTSLLQVLAGDLGLASEQHDA